MTDTRDPLADADMQSEISFALASSNDAREVANYLRAILARHGLAVLTVEPTRAMWAAGGTAQVNTRHVHHDKAVEAIWRAMLAASQEPGA